MRASQRDTLILLLAFAAGSLDAWSYFQLGRVFIANMTGNTLLFGFAAATGHWSRARFTALTLGSYAAGVFSGSLLSKPIRKATKDARPEDVLWPARTTLILALELAFVLAAASIAAILAPTTGSPVAKLLVCLGAIAEGFQGAALVALNLPGIVTTYISGTWTTFTSGLAQLFDGEEADRRFRWEKRLLLQAGVLAVYCASAALTGWMVQSGGRSALGWIPAAALTVAVTGAKIWGRRPKR